MILFMSPYYVTSAPAKKSVVHWLSDTDRDT